MAYTHMWRHRLLVVLLGIFASSTIFVWQLVFADAAPGILTVAFLDVGQGDAIFIEAPNGHQVLIDGGRGHAVLEGLGALMPFSDHSIDVVLATHPDMDHIGGLPDVFARYDIGMFLEPGVADDGADQTALDASVTEEGLQPVFARRGMVLVLDKGVALTILFPDRDVTNVDPNVGSTVARLTYGGTSFLFTGDSPIAIERYLVSIMGRALKSDVLKLGHHGSHTSSSETYLEYVDPTYAVISAGCDNQYGHPHKDVVERVAHLGIESHDTCHEGVIIFKSDGNIITVQ